MTKVNPLDPLIRDLQENRNYLEDRHRVVLAGLVQEYLQANADYEDGKLGTFSLKKQINQQLRVLKRMQDSVLTAENIDIADQKAVIAAGNQLMQMLQKFKVEMERESREKILEDAIKDTFNEIKDDNLKVKFMNILRAKLAKNNVQKAQDSAVLTTD